MVASERKSVLMLLLGSLVLACGVRDAAAVSNWTATFYPSTVTIHMHETANVNLTITGLDVAQLKQENATVAVVSENEIAVVHFVIPLDEVKDGAWLGTFPINAIFLGSAKVSVVITKSGIDEASSNTLAVIIIREERVIDKVFTISVAALVSILYINFGAAIDLTKVKGILRRPIGPLIAMFCQFLFLPVVSKVRCIYPEKDSVLMLFFLDSRSVIYWAFGCSPNRSKCNWAFSSQVCRQAAALLMFGVFYSTAIWICPLR